MTAPHTLAVAAAMLALLACARLADAYVQAGCTVVADELTSCAGFTGTSLEVSSAGITSVAVGALGDMADPQLITKL